jgi:hypothetical protein
MTQAEAVETGSLASYGASSFINSNVYTGADSLACIQLWSLHEQCHQLSGWGVVSLLYLLACALQYRCLDNKLVTAALLGTAWSVLPMAVSKCCPGIQIHIQCLL